MERSLVVSFEIFRRSIPTPGYLVTVRVAILVVPLKVAEIVGLFVVVTTLVLIVKVAVVPPLATVTLAGTLATAILPLVNVTTAPSLGAGPLRVTVPVELLPPNTLVGLNASELNAGGVTVKLAVLVAPP